MFGTLNIDYIELLRVGAFVLFVASAVGVTVGVFWENEDFEKSKRHKGWLLLVWSLGAEILLTIFIFVSDGEISSRQRAEIISLQKKLAPRALSRANRDRIVEKMKQFAAQEYFGMVASDVGDAWDIWREVSLALELANWKRLPPPGASATSFGPPAGIPLAPQPGVMILFSASQWNALHSRAEVLAAAITDEGIAAGAGPAVGAVDGNPNALMIVIGPKPQ